MKNLINKILLGILYLVLLILTLASFNSVYYLIKYMDKTDIARGKIVDTGTSSSSNYSYTFYYIKSNQDGKIYCDPGNLGVIFYVGDSVVFRLMHNADVARIISVNHKRVDTYYYIGDYFFALWNLAFILYVGYKIRKRYYAYIINKKYTYQERKRRI